MKVKDRTEMKVPLIVGLAVIGVSIWLLTHPDIEWKLGGGLVAAVGVWCLVTAYRLWYRSRWRPPGG